MLGEADGEEEDAEALELFLGQLEKLESLEVRFLDDDGNRFSSKVGDFHGL